MNINTVTKNYDPIHNTFCGYLVTLNNSSVELIVPLDTANSDYQAIQEWIADGNSVIDPNAE